MRRYIALFEFQEQVRRLTLAHEKVRVFIPTEWRNQHHRELDISPIDIAYSFSYKDYDDQGRGFRRTTHGRDDLKDLKIEAPEFDGNLNQEIYLD